jgi:hypothetical protein
MYYPEISLFQINIPLLQVNVTKARVFLENNLWLFLFVKKVGEGPMALFLNGWNSGIFQPNYSGISSFWSRKK